MSDETIDAIEEWFNSMEADFLTFVQVYCILIVAGGTISKILYIYDWRERKKEEEEKEDSVLVKRNKYVEGGEDMEEGANIGIDVILVMLSVGAAVCKLVDYFFG